VLQLVGTLLNKGRGYMVYLDNLFTSRRLFSQLRKDGIGAAGTVRTQNTKAELIEAGVGEAEAERMEVEYLGIVEESLVRVIFLYY
jgi:hypothetical protein